MKPIVLCILDGVGIKEKYAGNAFCLANKPTYDYIYNNYPHSILQASENAVGLPAGQMGNSEVGHINIGAGRVVFQSLELINNSIKSKEFYHNQEFLNVIRHCQSNNSSLHLIGLLSNGGIHSSIEHLFSLIELAKQNNVSKVYIHPILDGRDTKPKEALTFLNELSEHIKDNNNYKIATISGRYYAMDRDNRWDRIELSYNALVNKTGNKFSSYQQALEDSYQKNITDEFFVPAIIDEQGIIKDNDGVIWFNYRTDRSRELPTTLTNYEFSEFPIKKFSNLKFVTMMPVNESVKASYAFKNPELINTFGQYVSDLGLKQLRIAETEKYAHVTYFFDGGEEKKLNGCDRILIPSPKVATYDLSPKMSAEQITSSLIDCVENYDYVILNFANGDMLGHTGNISATITGVETVDVCLKKIYNKLEAISGTLVICADHGNCEEMLDEQNNVLTAHTLNPVNLIVTRKDIKLKDGCLGDIAPTLLALKNIPIPPEMTGKKLI